MNQLFYYVCDLDPFLIFFFGSERKSIWINIISTYEIWFPDAQPWNFFIEYTHMNSQSNRYLIGIYPLWYEKILIYGITFWPLFLLGPKSNPHSFIRLTIPPKNLRTYTIEHIGYIFANESFPWYFLHHFLSRGRTLLRMLNSASSKIAETWPKYIIYKPQILELTWKKLHAGYIFYEYSRWGNIFSLIQPYLLNFTLDECEFRTFTIRSFRGNNRNKSKHIYT